MPFILTVQDVKSFRSENTLVRMHSKNALKASEQATSCYPDSLFSEHQIRLCPHASLCVLPRRYH